MRAIRRVPSGAPCIRPGTELPKIGGGKFVVVKRFDDHYEIAEKPLGRFARLRMWWWRLWQ